MQENDWIQRSVVQPFTKSQQFIMNILCEYYEQRLEKDRKRIANLEHQNQMLLKENDSLKAQTVVLLQEKNYLSTRLKAANNMLRILMKTKEDVNSCKTPIKINVSDVDHLLQKKLNETTKVPNIKKNVPVKSKPAIKVVQKKEVKKATLPKEKENLSCVKRTFGKLGAPKQKEASDSALKKPLKILAPKNPTPKISVIGAPKQKEASDSALKKPTKILSPKNPTPIKSVILFKSKGIRIDSGTLMIPSKTKDTGKIEQKGVPVYGQKKGISIKRLQPKKNEAQVQKNMNETFVVQR